VVVDEVVDLPAALEVDFAVEADLVVAFKLAFVVVKRLFGLIWA